jgi:hypothetical protein
MARASGPMSDVHVGWDGASVREDPRDAVSVFVAAGHGDTAVAGLAVCGQGPQQTAVLPDGEPGEELLPEPWIQGPRRAIRRGFALDGVRGRGDGEGCGTNKEGYRGSRPPTCRYRTSKAAS